MKLFTLLFTLSILSMCTAGQQANVDRGVALGLTIAEKLAHDKGWLNSPDRILI